MSMFDVSYDKEAQAAYIRLSYGRPVARTEELIEDLAWMDLDAEGHVLGVEVIGVEDTAHLEGVVGVVERHFGTPSDLRDNRELLAALD